MIIEFEYRRIDYTVDVAWQRVETMSFDSFWKWCLAHPPMPAHFSPSGVPILSYTQIISIPDTWPDWARRLAKQYAAFLSDSIRQWIEQDIERRQAEKNQKIEFAKKLKRREEIAKAEQEAQGTRKESPTAQPVNDLTPMKIGISDIFPAVTEAQSSSDSHPAREPGEDEAGIDGAWPPKAWPLAEWVRGASGDFHVRATLTGDMPIARGFSWID